MPGLRVDKHRFNGGWPRWGRGHVHSQDLTVGTDPRFSGSRQPPHEGVVSRQKGERQTVDRLTGAEVDVSVKNLGTDWQRGGNRLRSCNWWCSKVKGSARSRLSGTRQLTTNNQGADKVGGGQQLGVGEGVTDLDQSIGGVPRSGAVSGAEKWHLEIM